jgi:penicillin-binding protein 1A
MVSMLEGVVQRGTGSAARAVGVPLAGKTGTTNDNRDAWFVGFSPNLAAGVFVGFDEPLPLGRAETGGRAAAPIFAAIMKDAVGGKPAIPFRVPPGITLVKVNHKTGRLANGESSGVILEAFKEGTEPRLEVTAPSVGLFGSVPDPSNIYSPDMNDAGPVEGAVLDGGAPLRPEDYDAMNFPGAPQAPGAANDNGETPPQDNPFIRPGIDGMARGSVPDDAVPADRIPGAGGKEPERPGGGYSAGGEIGSGTGGLY